VTVRAFSTCRSLLVLVCVSFCTTSRPLAAQSSPDDAAEKAGAHSRSAYTTQSDGSQPALDDKETPQAALDHYELGRRYYLAGRYREALTELKDALDLDRDAPDLLYNVARVYENLNELDQAIAYYQRYLEQLPLSQMEDRDRTEKTIRRLQGAKQLSPSRPKAAIVRQDAASSHFGRADLAFWITAGAGIALLAGGATCGVLAIRSYDAVGAFVVGGDGSWEKRTGLSDDTKRFALLADGLFIASGLALTSAALLFLLRDAEQPEPRAGAWHFGLNVAGPAAQLSVTRRF
jgi:tetratricopeptide (TPR) repeat protein